MIPLLLALALTASAQEPVIVSSPTPGMSLLDRQRLDAIDQAVTDLQGGHPTITGLPKFAQGIKFNDGTTQTTTATATGYRVRLRQGSAQAIANATATELTYDTEIFDPYDLHSTASNTGTITVPTGGGGLWWIECTPSLNSATDGAREVSIFVSGTEIQRCNSRAPNRASFTHCSTIQFLADAATITCKFLHNNGVSENTLASSLNTFSAVRIWP